MLRYFLIVSFLTLSSISYSTEYGWRAIVEHPSSEGGACHHCDSISEDCVGVIWAEDADYDCLAISSSAYEYCYYHPYSNWGRDKVCVAKLDITDVADDELDELVMCLVGITGFDPTSVKSWLKLSGEAATGWVIDGWIPEFIGYIYVAHCFSEFNPCLTVTCWPEQYWYYYSCNDCAVRLIDVSVYPPRVRIVPSGI